MWNQQLDIWFAWALVLNIVDLVSRMWSIPPEPRSMACPVVGSTSESFFFSLAGGAFGNAI